MMGIIRIYNGNKDSLTSNVLGLNVRALPIAEAPAFGEFMTAHGYDWKPLRYEEQLPSDSVSWGHIEVSPALQANHVQELGELCMQQTVLQPSRPGRKDSNAVAGLIIVDNRQPLSQQTFAPHVFMAGV